VGNRDGDEEVGDVASACVDDEEESLPSLATLLSTIKLPKTSPHAAIPPAISTRTTDQATSPTTRFLSAFIAL